MLCRNHEERWRKVAGHRRRHEPSSDSVCESVPGGKRHRDSRFPGCDNVDAGAIVRHLRERVRHERTCIDRTDTGRGDLECVCSKACEGWCQ